MTTLITIKEPTDANAEYPSYSDEGRVLVQVYGPGHTGVYRWETDVLDYDHDTSVFYLNEGMGFDIFFDDVDFPGSGVWVVERIHGEYIRGDGWSTDDDEVWEYWGIRPATEVEVHTSSLVSPEEE